MHLLPDSNVWISTRLLTNALGSAVTFYLSQVDGRIVLPRMTELEIRQAARRAASDANTKFAQAVAECSRFTFETSGEHVDEVDVVEAVERRLSQLDRYLVRVPTTLEVANAALERVIERVAPSAGKEQFRDALFWATALGLSRSDEVHVITNDHDFFEGSDNARRPAHPLDDEIAAADGRLHIHQDVSSFLAILRQEVLWDHEDAAKDLDDVLHGFVAEGAKEREWVIRELREFRISAFPTSELNEHAVAFEFDYPASKLTDSGVHLDGLVKAVGSCTLDSARDEYRDITLTRIQFTGSAAELPYTIFYSPGKKEASN